MKLVASIYNLKQLNKFISYLDGAILNVPFYSLIYENLDLDKAILFCQHHHVLPIISLNRLFHPDEIAKVSEVLKKYKNQDVLFLVTDIGVVNLARKEEMVNRIIYDPQTMIANELDLQAYADLGFHSLAMSLEIPFSDVIKSIEKTQAKVFYQVFGHRLMFYSNRKLITLFQEHANIKVEKQSLYLRERTREDKYPVIENENGTMIYRSYLLSLLNCMDKEKLVYGYMESLYMEDELFLSVLKIYHAFLKDELSIKEAEEKIKKLSLPIEDGFTYQDSVYQKELF